MGRTIKENGQMILIDKSDVEPVIHWLLKKTIFFYPAAFLLCTMYIGLDISPFAL